MSREPVVDLGASVAEADRLRRAGALPQALQVLGRAVDLSRSGADQMEVCTARRMLAEVMCELGDRSGACEVLSELLADAQKSFGPRHPASVRTLAVLAAVVHELGDHDTAERLYREVGERIGDKESRAGSLVRVRLALLQRDRGNIDAAREELAVAYQRQREAFGAEDADTVTIAAQLAELHRDAGDSAAARRVLTVAYVAACSSLGEDHELTRNLETDLEALEAPMPSAPVELPEDSQSTRSIKRRHSKKGVPAAAAVAPARAAAPVAAPARAALPASSGGFPAAPASPAPFPAAPTSSGGFPAAPASAVPFPAAPASAVPFPAAPTSSGAFPAGFPAAPASPAPFAGSPAGYRALPAAPASLGAFSAAPASPGPFPATPASPAAFPAAPASPGPYPAAPVPTRPAQIPAQTRGRRVQPEPGLSGRRTQLSSERLAALAAAETAVIDPVQAPYTNTARPRRRSATVLVVLMVLIAIGGGAALAAIGAMLALQP